MVMSKRFPNLPIHREEYTRAFNGNSTKNLGDGSGESLILENLD